MRTAEQDAAFKTAYLQWKAETGPETDAVRRRIEADILTEEKYGKAADWRKRWKAACEHQPVMAFQTAPEIPPVENRVSEIGFHHDCGFIEGPEVAAELSDDDRRFAFSAHGRFLALAKEKTGDTLPPEKLDKIRRENAELLRQSHAMAEKMGRAGFNCYRETPFGLYRYYVHSRHIEKLPCFRRVTFLPYVAKQLRGPMVSALESFTERYPTARMWVMTSGPKTPMAGVRERAKWMHGRISDLNAAPFMRDAGVEIVFRSTELGTPEYDEQGNAVKNAGEIETDETGQMYFHVHAHLVVIQKKGFIAPPQWDVLLKKVGGFWGYWWKESGLILKPREVCKYVTKPNSLDDLTGEQLVALREQLKRLKLVQPMGALAREIEQRKSDRERIVRLRTPDGPVCSDEKNWNLHYRRTRMEKHADAGRKLDPDRLRSGAESQRVVAMQLPGFGPSGVSEPVVVVMATTWNEEAVRRDSRVARLIACTSDEYWAGQAIRVHTCTSTVGETGAFEFAQKLDPPRGRLTGAEKAGFSR